MDFSGKYFGNSDSALFNLFSLDGVTEFHKAVYREKWMQMEKLFPEAKKLISTKTKSWETPLHFAAASGETQMGHWLLNLNADIASLNVTQQSPFVFALLNKKYLFIDCLYRKAIDDNNESAMKIFAFEAAKYGEWDIVEKFLGKNSNIYDFKDNKGYSLLHFAAAFGNTQLVKRLLNRNADIALMSANKQSPFTLALLNKHYDVAKLLSKKAIEDNNALAMQIFALEAAEDDAWSIVESILEKAISSPHSCKNSKGHSLLHFAAACEKTDIVGQLMKDGADITSLNVNQQSPLALAFSNNKPQAAQLLYQKAIEDNNETAMRIFASEAAEYSEWGIVGQLFEKNPNIYDFTDTEGYPFLHCAAKQGNCQIADHFIKTGANINLQDDKGMTPIAYAIVSKQSNMVNLLLAARACIDNNAYRELEKWFNSSIEIQDSDAATKLLENNTIGYFSHTQRHGCL